MRGQPKPYHQAHLERLRNKGQEIRQRLRELDDMIKRDVPGRQKLMSEKVQAEMKLSQISQLMIEQYEKIKKS